MGHSYIDYKDESIHLNDIDIIWAVHVMSHYGKQLLEERNIKGNAFEIIFDFWKETSLNGGVGCIDLKLDSYLADEKMIEFFIEVIELSIKQVPDSNDMIDCDYPGDGSDGKLNLGKANKDKIIETLLKLKAIVEKYN